MFRYFFQRILCAVLSLALGAGIVLLAVGGVAVALLQNESYVQGNINKNKTQVIEAVDSALDSVADITGLDKEAYAGAVNEDNFDIVSGVVARNLIYGYSTDFSDNTDLYDVLLRTITDYSQSSGKSLSSAELSKDASFAVDAVNYAISANDTAWVQLFNVAQGKLIMYIVFGAIALIIVCIVGIDILNRGRHRKFSFFGMGIITAGYLLVIVPLFVRQKNYLGAYGFLSFEPYNKAVEMCVNDMMNLYFLIGAIAFVCGFTMLIVNYNYFRKKNKRAKAARERSEQFKNDYLETERVSRQRRLESGEFEKEILEIDFEQ